MTELDRRRLWFAAAFVVAANCLDLASTYAASPDLANEWNLLQRQFGLGWAGLICAKLIGAWFAIAGYRFYLRHRNRAYPAMGADLNRFCHHLSFGNANPAAGPADAWLRIGVSLGYFWAGMQALVVWVAFDNLLLRFGITVSVRQYSEMAYHMLQSCVIATIVLARFYLGNFRRYQDLSVSRAVVVSASSDSLSRR